MDKKKKPVKTEEGKGKRRNQLFVTDGRYTVVNTVLKLYPAVVHLEFPLIPSFLSFSY